MNNNLFYFVMAMIILCWVINPFLRKIILKKISSLNLQLYNEIIILSLSLLTFIYMRYRNPTEYSFSSISKLNNNERLLLFTAGVSTYFSSLALIWLLKYSDASQLIPQLQPCVIILTILVGVFIYKEKININQFYGVLLLIAGIFMTNYYKDK